MQATVFLTLLGATSADPNRLASLKSATSSVSVPAGVNFGGWLCLEDWFYSGTYGKSVSTGSDQPSGQGSCLPPLITQLDDHWPSEGRLTKKLNDTLGPAKTIEAFMAHRRSFIGTRDLEAVRDLGIKTIRVPITWAAFADALAPIDSKTYGSHNADNDAVLVPDPFYSKEALLVTIPRSWLKMFINKCRKHGLQVILDLHAFPGASSDGTYNGVWPSPPKFWQGNAAFGESIQLTEAGHMITKAMIKWVEELDAETRQGVKGLTLMNEPGHLSAWADWASEGQILAWLDEAGGQFRESKLPGLGVKLYMNMIETAFQNFGAIVPPWWNKTFTEQERNNWAVMDIHWYTAWGGQWSSGRTVSGGGYFCDDPLDEIRTKLENAAEGHAKDVRGMFGATALQAVSEFSIGTFSEALSACTDPAVQEMFLDVQVKAFNAANIEPFFWTWRMPYGPAFEPGWSLKHTMGKENVLQAFPCLQPVAANVSAVPQETFKLV